MTIHHPLVLEQNVLSLEFSWVNKTSKKHAGRMNEKKMIPIATQVYDC